MQFGILDFLIGSMNNYLAVNDMINVLLLTFESFFGISKLYISKDYLYNIDDYAGVYQEQIVDLNNGLIFNKDNQIFKLYTEKKTESDQNVLNSINKFEYVIYRDMECIVFKDTINKGNYIGYISKLYSKLPEIFNLLMEKEKCLKIPGSIIVDSDIYFRIGILESHDLNFTEINTLKMWELKSIESLKVDSTFFSDKLITR